MLYRKMPKNGDMLSALGFGCMRLPGKNFKIDQPLAIGLIRSAIDRGVNYVDTAWPYHGGESEPLLGAALKDGYRQKVKIATKLPSWLVKTREDMDSFLDRQLKKLDVEYIDYYLVHALNGGQWNRLLELGVTGFLDSALKDGRIRNAGFSFHGESAEFAPIIDSYPWVFCQIQYNYLDREIQAGLSGLKYAAAKNLGVIVMEPLRGGNLAAKVPPAPIQKLWDEAAVRRSPADWALRWVWNHPEVTVALSGMNSEEQLAENLAVAGSAAANGMSAAELALVDRVAKKYTELIKVGCTGCGYCLPCPVGVQIPVCFDEFNHLHMFGDTPEVHFRYVFRTSGAFGDGKTGFASQCVNCGQCVEKCPQGIKIPEVLSQIPPLLETPDIATQAAGMRQMFSK